MTPLVEPLAGRFYRMLFVQDLLRLLDGAIRPEGRFHHSGQPALHLSPSVEAAGFAVDIYVGSNDPPRVVQPMVLTGARIMDLRRPEVFRHFGLNGNEPSVPWLPEREAGMPATSWRASDAVRKSAVDGMVFSSRRNAARWHLVLFQWNALGHATVTRCGSPVEFHP